MFIAMIAFPIRPDKEEEFRKWFSRTNKEFAGHKGLIARRLIRPVEGGNYTIMVEHESHDTFIAGSSHPDHIKAGDLLAPMLSGEPVPQFYEVILE